MGLLDLGNETTVLYVEPDVVAKCWLKEVAAQLAAVALLRDLCGVSQRTLRLKAFAVASASYVFGKATTLSRAA